MIPSTPVSSPATPSDSDLDPLFARIASANPFTDNRSIGPSVNAIDVEHIHAKQFERLCALAKEAHEQGRGLGAMLWGEAGIGKSHLLARLARWAERNQRACFVYLHNLQARPDHLPRSVLKSVLSVLTRGQSGNFANTLLFRLANAFMREALHYDPSKRYTWEDLECGYDKLIDRLSADEPTRAALVDRTVYQVVRRFFSSAYRDRAGDEDGQVARLAVRWLASDLLDPDEARLLGLPPERNSQEPAGLADDQQIKLVLTVLCRMAFSRRQPFILCFDQVDNLDTGQAAALARFLAALLDSSANLLVVTAGIQATLLQWRTEKVIQDSAWDRLAQFEIALLRSSVAEGHAIVATRLQRFLEPVAPGTTVHRYLSEEPLFPLGKAWADTFLKHQVEVRPRDVLTWAREGWQREQAELQELGGPAWLTHWRRDRPSEPAVLSWTTTQIQDGLDARIAQKFAEHITQRKAEPHTLPPNAANLSGLVGVLLEQCLPADATGPQLHVKQPPASQRGRRSPYDLIVERRHLAAEEPLSIGLVVLTTESAHAATTALRRLVDDAVPPPWVFLLTDVRTGLPLGPRGADYYKQLHQRGQPRFRHLQLTFAQYAELDALQGTVGLARSGDLEIALPGGTIRTLRPEEVIASHQRQGRYRTAAILKELLSVFSESSRPVPAELNAAAS